MRNILAVFLSSFFVSAVATANSLTVHQNMNVDATVATAAVEAACAAPVGNLPAGEILQAPNGIGVRCVIMGFSDSQFCRGICSRPSNEKDIDFNTYRVSSSGGYSSSLEGAKSWASDYCTDYEGTVLGEMDCAPYTDPASGQSIYTCATICKLKK